jgi:uncharacterized protein (DUF58 family)
MITTDFLSSLDRFNLIVKKRVTSKYSGARPSMFTGRGATIKDHRIYAYGDDFRLIDWRIYAKTDNLYVKQYEEEKNLVVHLILDASASMNYGRIPKFDYAAMLGVGFAYLALKENEKFQFATFSKGLEVFQPKRGLGHLANMVDYLNKLKPTGTSNFLNATSKYRKLLGTRALIVLASDFLFDLEEIKTGLHMFGDNDIKVIQVLDDSEKDLTISGDVKLHDSETKETMRTYISPRLKSQYVKELDNHAANIHKACQAIKADFYQLTTSTPLFDAFYEILK